MAHLATDLAVTLPEDRPGMLAKAINALSGAGINIEGYAEIEGLVHLLTINAAETKDALDKNGFRIVREQQVVIVPVEDRPGSAAAIFQRIGEAKVNMRFSYLAMRNRLVVGADDAAAVVKALTD